MRILLLVPILFSLVGFADTATYQVTIKSNWSRKAHLSRPGSAHFSPVLAVTHNANFELLPFGGLTSAELEPLAELGDESSLATLARSRDSVDRVVRTENQFIRSNPSQTFEVKVTKDFPFFSFVSMIAPSPDWMIGVANLKLFSEEQGFKPGVTDYPLFAIDAGTENGDRGGNFSLRNSPTNPPQPINFLRGRGFDAPFAYVTIKKLEN